MEDKDDDGQETRGKVLALLRAEQIPADSHETTLANEQKGNDQRQERNE